MIVVGSTGRHYRSGWPVRVIAVEGDVITVEYTSGPMTSFTARYHADEVGDHLIFGPMSSFVAAPRRLSGR